MTTVRTHYLHHRIDCEPMAWNAVGKALVAKAPAIEAADGLLYGIWRSQIGQPRDTLNAITVWGEAGAGQAAFMDLLGPTNSVRTQDVTAMTPTLRPLSDTPPRRQGNFAFRWFETPRQNWQEFLDLCAQAWPGFESSYDSQVIGLWKVEDVSQPDVVRSLLLTRRPDLAMWERSKIPQGEKEQAVRDALSRRYDLCSSTYVYTTTLMTAEDREDRERWT
ncbi:hypothetical protein [Bradyrhizobium sp. LHD-71]|uniref:hypothetical protein n=1 Tax=Bradyrhizobium sp. LHD-71 TaxID=3072141 RepID=UPI00280E9706|nr:hypothetical protein [Bradyrhizobium sp. LHD-71]MDQ8726302.1 hypothetical protein [Bradyrhizobium sp. LHD-71]